ncbi:MAG: helix-turn-helix domain-containing protein [Clostridia bacterium]|nr:helix-turn-helix domain-containing protein [Clostridia bacterium]
MQTFGEQLIVARKAKGMTQEALAQAADISRSTISSWERGRTIPDYASVRRLSEILDYDFSQTAEGQSAAPAVEDAVPPEVEPQDAPTLPNVHFSHGGVRRRVQMQWIVAGTAALVCIVLFILLLFSRQSAPVSGGEGFNAEDYQQETPSEAGKAYITFENRTWTEGNGGTEYQMYDFTLTERNGIAFSIARIDVEMEGKTGAVRSMSMSAADLETVIDPDLPAYGSVTIDGGFPKGEFTRIGIAAYGSDANGEPQTFYDLIEF